MIKEYHMGNTFNEKDIKDTFDSFSSYTQEDAKKVLSNESEIRHAFDHGPLLEFLDTAGLYFQMIKDYFRGEYKEVPVGTIAAVIGTLLYVLAPVDLIPDFIPVVGYLDDAAVFAMCLRFTEYDLEKYKRFKEERES